MVVARLNVVMPNDIRSQMSSLLDLNYTTTEPIAVVARNVVTPINARGPHDAMVGYRLDLFLKC